MDESLIPDYFPGLSSTQISQLAALKDLYTYWNERINVISRKDILHLYERHILHSLSIARFYEFPEKTRILDVGTGGGFPGIPLAILFPHASFLLVDSIAKKIRVVKEIAHSIGLKNIEAHAMRAEQVKEPMDFVVSRAVARTNLLLRWTSKLLMASSHPTRPNGYILLKGGDLEEELKEINRPYQVLEITDYFNRPFFETKKLIYIPI